MKQKQRQRIVSMDQLRAGFGQYNRDSNSFTSNYYPFWNMQEGQQAVVRFLPDKDLDNPLCFCVEKSMHILVINGEEQRIPCMKMYGEECPICKVSSSYYKSGDEDTGKKYYRKRSWLAQVLVVEDPLPPDPDTGETHEGKIRLLNITRQIFDVIKDTYEELDVVPFAYEGGTDFIIKKTLQGKHANYSVASKFARRSTDLTPDQIELAEEESIELHTLLPQAPELTRVEMMLEAALNGTEYVENKQPANSTIVDLNDGPEDPPVTAKVTNSKPAGKRTYDPLDDQNDGLDGIDDDTDEILAAIKSRHQSKT